MDLSLEYLWLGILLQIALLFIYGLIIWKPWQGEQEEQPRTSFWDEGPDDRNSLYCVNMQRHELRHVDLAAQELHIPLGEFMRRAAIKDANRVMPLVSNGNHAGEREPLPRL